MRISLILLALVLVDCNGNNGQSQDGASQDRATGYDVTVSEYVLDYDVLHIRVALQDGDTAVKDVTISGSLICRYEAGIKTLSTPDTTTDDQGRASMAFKEMVVDSVCDLNISYTIDEGRPPLKESMKVLVTTPTSTPPPPIVLTIERAGTPFCADTGTSHVTLGAMGAGLSDLSVPVNIDLQLLYSETAHNPSPTDAGWKKVDDVDSTQFILNTDGTVTPDTAAKVKINLYAGKIGSYVRACSAVEIDVGGNNKERICSEPVLVQVAASGCP